MLFSRMILASKLAAGVLAATWIVPGAVWKDTSGNTIDAHGGMIQQRGTNFYWIGQAASDSVTPYLYRSTDLLNWTPLGAQASIQWLWRPKIAKPNGSFWIYGQVDRLVQALVSTQMEGGYKTKGAAVALPPNSYTYSDTGMFQDPDSKTWYLMTSADHNTVQINQINSDGTIGDRTNRLAAGAYEAPGMFKVGNTYFLIVSGKTGWRSNPNKMFWCTGIGGSFTGPFDIAPQAENTYNSQNTFELTIKGTQATTYIYMGDSWDSTGGPSSTYIWLPMAVDANAHTVNLQYHSMWKVDVTTGYVSWPSTKKRYEAETAAISGRAGESFRLMFRNRSLLTRLSAIRDCSDCISKRSVHQINTQSQVTFHNITGTGEPQWVSLHYTVNNATGTFVPAHWLNNGHSGEAHILVNDQAVPTNISSMNSRAGHHKSVPVELTLKPGDINKITFGVTGCEDFEAHLDGVEIFEDA
ncbi:Arabinanase/levansucrase/invertase [Leptodontidium sp. MPI-SDFR-AT-0119]|nr:Arabinanase/levansucrase/invertase [Leptodontidium sp. MPI-SDFR-AT-0119]